MGSIVLDSSVLIALLNAGDKHHVAAREAIKNKNIFFVSAISFAEVLPTAISQGKGDFIRENIKLAVSKVFDVTEEIAISAAEIRASKGGGTPDAVISATAKLAKAELWTFDKRLAKNHPGARLLA
jgi:predicted nucleic acid-binding protein